MSETVLSGHRPSVSLTSSFQTVSPSGPAEARVGHVDISHIQAFVAAVKHACRPVRRVVRHAGLSVRADLEVVGKVEREILVIGGVRAVAQHIGGREGIRCRSGAPNRFHTRTERPFRPLWRCPARGGNPNRPTASRPTRTMPIPPRASHKRCKTGATRRSCRNGPAPHRSS